MYWIWNNRWLFKQFKKLTSDLKRHLIVLKELWNGTSIYNYICIHNNSEWTTIYFYFYFYVNQTISEYIASPNCNHKLEERSFIWSYPIIMLCFEKGIVTFLNYMTREYSKLILFCKLKELIHRLFHSLFKSRI